jgi:hypothetical protein
MEKAPLRMETELKVRAVVPAWLAAIRHHRREERCSAHAHCVRPHFALRRRLQIRQTCGNIEIIVVVDGEDDASVHAVR